MHLPADLTVEFRKIRRPLRNRQGRLPRLVFRQRLENFRGQRCVVQDDGVHGPAERRFECGNELAIDIQIRHERACDRRPDPIGIVQSLQHRLRAFLQSFAFFRHLAQHFEARLFFGDHPIDPRNLFLSVGETRLLLLLLLFRMAQTLSQFLRRLLLAFHRRLRAGEIGPRFFHVMCLFADRAVQLGDSRSGRIASRGDTGQIILKRRDSAFEF